MIPLLVIRHGVTDWNSENRLQGQSDKALSEVGRNEVGTWTLPTEFTAFRCVSSPLQRARETATLLDLSPTIEPALMEMAWGDWEGENWQVLQSTLGSTVMAAHEADGLDFCPPGGESPRDVQSRLRPWLEKLADPTVAICHKGVLQALYSLATGWQMKEKAPIKFRHGAAYLFNIEGGKPTLGNMNISLESK